jgi:hypothetical protein
VISVVILLYKLYQVSHHKTRGLIRQLTESGCYNSHEMLDTCWKLSCHVMGSFQLTFSINESKMFLVTEGKKKNKSVKLCSKFE